MKRSKRYLVVLLFLCMAPALVMAQGDCPTIVQSALAATDSACSGTGRNQACYGNLNLTAVPEPGVNNLSFSKPGDLVDVGSVQSLDLSPLDPQGQTWGVALMKLQANLPDTLPGQNVTFLMFGNVEIENAVEAAVSEVQKSNGATLQATVSSMSPMIESLTAPTPKMLNAGDVLTVDGQDSSMQMLHVQTADGKTGWVPSATVTVQGDVSTLPALSMVGGAIAAIVPTVPPAPQQSPMQAFYFRTGANDAPCTEAPDSGILIQTPEGAGKISLTMNGVDVQLGSSAYVQAAPHDDNPQQEQLTINIVEGQGLVNAQGEVRVVPAGTRVRVPLRAENNHLVADGPPSDLEPYDDAALASLPVGHLERPISVARALSADEIAGLSSSVNPVAGVWTYTQGQATAGAGCPEMMVNIMGSIQMISTKTVTIPEGPFDFQAVLQLNDAEVEPGAVFSNPEPGLFVMEWTQEGSTVRWDMRVISSTRIEGLTTIDVEGCTITIPSEMIPTG